MDQPYRREQSLGYLTNWAGRLLVRTLERRLEGGGAGTMPVFFALLEHTALPQKTLAQWAAVEQPTMANTLVRMERDGLVVRAADPADKRSMLVRLTPLGLKRAGAAMKAAKATNDLALTALGPGERELFLDMMHRIIAVLDADQV